MYQWLYPSQPLVKTDSLFCLFSKFWRYYARYDAELVSIRYWFDSSTLQKAHVNAKQFE
jgi:hypothetical protein